MNLRLDLSRRFSLIFQDLSCHLFLKLLTEKCRMIFYRLCSATIHVIRRSLFPVNRKTENGQKSEIKELIYLTTSAISASSELIVSILDMQCLH